MVNKKIGILIGVIVLIAVLVGAYSLLGTSSANQIRVGYLPSTGDSLYFIAKEKGFFADEGLDVTLNEFQTGPDEINALLADKLDVEAGGVGEPLNFINNGKDLVIIGGAMGGDSAVIAKDNATATATKNNPKAFEGKTVATVKMSTPDVTIKGALSEAGVNLSKVNFVEFKTAADVVQAVKTGKAPIGFVWPPFQYTAQQQGLVIVKYSDEYIPNHPCCRIVTTSAKVNGSEDKWVKFERALIKAYDYYKTNQTGTVEVVGKYVNMDPKALKQALYDGHLSLSPDPNKKGTLKYWDLLEVLGYSNITNPTALENSINTDLYKKALDQLAQENPKNTNYQDLLKLYQEQNVNVTFSSVANKSS
ncbi:ABC transporter substrate-binding protein [Methanobacterium alcaliphilum]|uniref:ABC transporter substrate-binding protein n=1 Tax=Methanobacterium alcaliphilum TaxID=392018 RepID=UPI00200AF679|nr:ABC transporter substrate-binding protein [Methanobacterium alcaliphilum]MCK9150672.1 ABC transporter substrate-binding protein [Methanobacterium alcaliphilum]